MSLYEKHCINKVWFDGTEISWQPLRRSPDDEQSGNLTSQKALQAVTIEKDSALNDLNSVERSLSDMFRRYENMKSTLDGFKKVKNSTNNYKRIIITTIIISSYKHVPIQGLKNVESSCRPNRIYEPQGKQCADCKTVTTSCFLCRTRKCWRTVPRSTWPEWNRRNRDTSRSNSTQRKNLTSEEHTHVKYIFTFTFYI